MDSNVSVTLVNNGYPCHSILLIAQRCPLFTVHFKLENCSYCMYMNKLSSAIVLNNLSTILLFQNSIPF